MKKIIIYKIIVSTFVALIVGACSSGDEMPSSGDPVSTNNAIVIDSDLREEMTLKNHAEGVDYIIENRVKIRSFITIEPGTTLAFKSDASLYVYEGFLSAKGTLESPILFQGEEQVSGFWRGIGFESSDVRNELNHVIIKDAGSNPISSTWYGSKAAVVVFRTVNKGKLTMKNSLIKETDGFGLVSMNGTTIQKFENNKLEGNKRAAIRVDAINAAMIDEMTTFSNNKFNGVSVRETKISSGSEYVWKSHDYFIDGKIDVRTGLKIESGAKLLFSPAGFIRVEGDNAFLNAVGDVNNKIVFTGEVTTSPSWKGISFFKTNNVSNKLSFCEVSYGGSEAQEFVKNKANITLFDGSVVTVENTDVSNSGGCGIVVGEKEIIGWRACTLKGGNNNFTANNSSSICNQKD